MTLDSAGDVRRLYMHGPAGEVLFDHAFDALGQETGVDGPSKSVRQSID